MIRSNEHYEDLPGSYLFAAVAEEVRRHREQHPERKVISLGIGDVTRPLVPAVIEALHRAVDEMGQTASFRGYGPEQGYDFLRKVIAEHDYRSRGVNIDPDDIFISDGAKCDVSALQELFSLTCRVAVTDPVYPVYVDSNAMCGRAGTWLGDRWSNLIYLPCTEGNNFVPDFPDEDHVPDVIYLCYPNNPTGTVLDRNALAAWVDYAVRHDSLIIYDAAYESFIRPDATDIPHSIFEIPGAEEVAVECRSFSKTAGFTGLRCAFTVIPAGVTARGVDGDRISLREMWKRRQSTRYNGCPYIVQRAAEAAFKEPARSQMKAVLGIYQSNADMMLKTCERLGLEAFGGVHSPYVWLGTPGGMDSWSFFDMLLEKAAVVCTPGVGFGASGEGYVRLTAFNTPELTRAALERLEKVIR